MFSASKTAVPSGFTINNSLRFRRSASAYLNRTFGTPTNTYKFTFSFWMKRGLLSGYTGMTLLGSNTYPNYLVLKIDGNNSGGNDLAFVYGGGAGYGGYTSAVFRDPSAWYHVVYAIDTTQSTDSNRVKIYVNGVQQTSLNTISGSSSTFPPQNTANPINTASMVNEIGAVNLTGSNGSYFDGYLAEVNFIDGQALTPSSFGEIDSTTGVWKAKRYTGTYGTNGFRLNFSNGTSTTTLGYDSSGNSNNWTTNNISLTAGSTYDWMIDSPTKYPGSSYGVGNYAVLNPLANPRFALPSFSNGNLKEGPNTTNATILATMAVASGKWYWETTVDTVADSLIGATSIDAALGSNQPGYIANSAAYLRDGRVKNNGSDVGTYATYTNGDIIAIALDMDAKTLTFYKNNSLIVTISSSISGTWVPALADFNVGGSVLTINFGQRPFSYTPPSGYNALNTYNLSTPSIVDGSKQFAASLYTGTGSSLSVSGANFTPGMVWVKSRSAATDHKLTDVVRGVTKALVSDSTAAETIDTNGLTAFNSNGFTVGTDTIYNNSGATYVGWQWKAGGTAVTNTAGSITSSVSANTTSGFSVVTWTCNNTANQSIGHGLGVAPSLVIVKDRDQGSGFNWNVWFTGFTANEYLQLNTTIAKASYSTLWYTIPDSTKIYIGTAGTAVNNATDKMVAYCFAAIPGYSAFGSYTGNGSADGPFVYCGFRPRFVMVKRTDSTGAWVMYDSIRLGYNEDRTYLQANSSSAEVTDAGGAGSWSIDLISNGFKLRASSEPTVNPSGGTVIYAAFAENPFQNALAR